MALPLLWLGAAALSAVAVKTISDDRKAQHNKRMRSYRAKSLDDLQRHESSVAIYPTDLFHTQQSVAPEVGALVCCGIGGVLDHSGIWVGDNTIVELDGRGLIKPVSAQRFTSNRTGRKIFIACDSNAQCLTDIQAARRAVEQIYQYQDYHVIDNNCHQFVWQCFQPASEKLTTFKQLNDRLARHFNRQIYWDICDCLEPL